MRKERFKSGAFGWQIEEFAKLQTELAKVMKDAHAEAVSILKEKIERRNVNLLSGHDFNRPLASMKAGTLKLVDSDDGRMACRATERRNHERNGGRHPHVLHAHHDIGAAAFRGGVALLSPWKVRRAGAI